MTVSSTDARITYAGDGNTTSFAVPFTFDADADLEVNIITDSTNDVTAQVLNTDYTISSTNVVMTSAPASGETLVITLGLTFEQSTNYVANDPFPAETHEDALDELAKQIKELKEDIDYRCVKLPVNTLSSTTVTDTDIAASKIFRINSAGTSVELATVNSITNGGDSWSDPINASITVDTDSTYDIGTNAARIANVYADNIYGTVMTAAQGNITSVGTLTSLTVDNLTINGNTISADSGNIIIGASDLIDMGGNTGAVGVPVGTTAQRDTTLGAGALRWNSTDGKLEAYSGSAWVQYTSAGGPGAWSDPIDSSITVDTDSTYDVGTSGARLANLYADNLYGVLAEAAQTNITSVGTLTALDVDNLNINGNTISASSGNVVIGSSDIIDMSGNTSHMLPPTGTTAQRTGSTAGELRYNSTTNKLEYYNGTTWVALEATSGGGMTLIATQTASSSATIDFDNNLDSTYESYLVTFSGVSPATDGANFECVMGTGATPTYQTGASDYSWAVGIFTTANTGSYDSSDDSIVITSTETLGSAVGEHLGGSMEIHSPSSTSLHTQAVFRVGFSRPSGQLASAHGCGKYLSTTAVTSVRFKMSSGNIATGEFKLYGLQKST